MKSYIAVLKEWGEGCDYTIGCGVETIRFGAENMEEAIDYIRNYEVIEYYGSDRIESCDIIEIADEVDFAAIYNKEESAREEEELKEQEALERESQRKQYESLKEEFENE
jgi:L-fucose isomerase-like protein